jgi:hypothetical protein
MLSKEKWTGLGMLLHMSLSSDRLCGLVVRVPGYTTETYCASCDVRTEFIYVIYKKVEAATVV